MLANVKFRKAGRARPCVQRRACNPTGGTPVK